MNSQEAKELLLLYRPGQDEQDPEFTAALEQTRNDPELAQWFDQHCKVQRTILASFDSIEPPEGLKEQIVSERKAGLISSLGQKPMALVLAAIPILLLVGLLVFQFRGSEIADLSTYRMRMAGKVLRDYPKMDLETSDLEKIRRYLAEHGGQKDYVLPPGLQKTAGTGCAIFDWKGKTVSMICFHSGKTQNPKTPDLFLFIVEGSAVKGPSTDQGPDIATIKSLSTVSWTNADKTYLLAGSGDQNFLKKYY